jgi:hypothetical protein
MRSAVQAAGCDQCADDQERHAEGQVEPGADRALCLDGVGVNDEYVQEADCEGDSYAAGQEARKHRARAAALYQQEVHAEQFRVQRREERQAEERRVHCRSADVISRVPSWPW